MTCDDDTPHVVTHVATTPAPTPDDHMLETSHATLAEKVLLPRDPLVAYGSTDAATFVASVRDYRVTIVDPVAADLSWQAREGTGYENGAFTINWETYTATCPQGKQSRKWQPDRDVTGQEVIQIHFANKDYRACAARPACTRAKTEPCTLTVRAQIYHAALQAARQRQTTAEFKEQYAARAGIEGTPPKGYALLTCAGRVTNPKISLAKVAILIRPNDYSVSNPPSRVVGVLSVLTVG